MRYYLVGGAVRDTLLGIVPHDVDIVFDGSVEAFLREKPHARRAGSGVPVFLADGHEYIPLNGESIMADVMNRDFTINALALDADGRLYMHPDSMNDLREGVIRPVSPGIFQQDPLRVFRAARFAAVFPDFSLHDSTIPHMRACSASGDLANIAPERVGQEITKTLNEAASETARIPRPGNFLRLLAASDSLRPWFAELDGADSIPAGPERYHGSDSVLEHTARVMDRIAEIYTRNAPADRRDIPLALWMGLCHDLGKRTTAPELLPRHLKHEERGEDAALSLAARLRLPKRWEQAGRLAARLHMKGGLYGTLRPGTRVDLLQTLHAAHIAEPFFTLVAADSGDDSLPERMRSGLRTILSIHLPPELRLQGPAAGQKLRELRCQALAFLA
ncbi:tRNA nucleotidyltransferase [Desulfovibrio sp. OttesenSCG-928-I05]|nr:tRNA nucleotidyltransferase [Desulfovibrio sp. OttesenSCG-928-I05]